MMVATFSIMPTKYIAKKSLPSTTLFTGSHSLHQAVNNLQFDGINHWIAKG